MPDDKSNMIGFAADELSARPLRIPLPEYRKGEWAVLAKPPNILFDAYLGAPKVRSIISAIRARLDKPEYKRLELSVPFAVNQIDFEISGGALMAMGEDSRMKLRNALGSDAFKFSYILLCRANPEGPHETFETELPMWKPDGEKIWAVSHRRGKKASTLFEPIEKSGEWQIWRAFTTMPRPHQIRLHAAERGLLISGESLYANIDVPRVSIPKDKMKKKLLEAKDKSPALWEYIGLHLYSIKCESLGISATIPLPDKFSTAIARLGFQAVPFNL